MKARGIKAFEANDPHKGSLFLKYKMNFILQICLFYISNNLKFKIKKNKTTTTATDVMVIIQKQNIIWKILTFYS